MLGIKFFTYTMRAEYVVPANVGGGLISLPLLDVVKGIGFEWNYHSNYYFTAYLSLILWSHWILYKVFPHFSLLATCLIHYIPIICLYCQNIKTGLPLTFEYSNSSQIYIP